VIANCVVVLAVVTLAARSLPPTSPTRSPTPAHPDASAGVSNGSGQPQGRAASPSPLSQACQRRAVDLLSQAGLGGTVALMPDGTLRFDLVCPIPQDQDTEEAAQRVWTAFDTAQALTQDQCNGFSRIVVLIQAHSPKDSLQIRASVDAADLDAYSRGEVTESTFIDHVQYEVDGSDG